MKLSVPSFARSRRLLAASLALVLAPLAAPRAARADGPTGIQPWRLEVGVGWTKDTASGAPDGSLGGQLGLHKGIWDPRLTIGVVGGYYALGEVTTQDEATGAISTGNFSVIPAWGQLTWDAAPIGDGWLELSAGAGAYVKKVSGIDDCKCTDFGLNIGLGYLSHAPAKQVSWGGEIRYHHLPREDNSGNKFLSLMLKVAWDFGQYGEGRF